MKNFTFCILMLCGWASHAQLIITNTAETPAQLVTDVLVDQSITPYNITFNGSAANANAIKLQAAHFTTNFNPTNLGLTAGVMLSTGNAQLGYGPNNGGGTSDPVTPVYNADTNLAALTTNNVVNSAVLEFDFVATGSQMSFDYVFASEEYPEFANTGFNDVFGFFLTGPNPANASVPYNAYNIAFVPNTTVPITINNVNNGQTNNGPCEYCTYYVNNGTGTTPAANPHVQYDGFTTVLTAVANLRCGEVYHMKLAIGNVGDNAYDSAVFLKDFKITPLALVDDTNLDENLSVCGDDTNLAMPPASYFTDQDLPVPDYILNPDDYNFYWSFNNTYDPANLPAYNPAAFVPVASILLPATVDDVEYTATQGGVYQLTVETSYDCKVAEDQITIWFQPNPLQTAPPLNICTSDPLPMNININQNAAILGTASASDYMITYYNSSELDATNGVPNGRIPTATLANYPMTTDTDQIWVRFEEVAGSGCVFVMPFTITIGEEPSGVFDYPQTPYCAELPLQLVNTTVTPGGTYTATPAGLSINSATGDIDPSASTPGSYLVDYVLPASATCPEFRVDDIPVAITATPAAPGILTPLAYCQGEAAPALSATGTNLLWYTAATGGTGSATAPTPDTSVSGPATYYVSQTNGCEGPRAAIVVNIEATPAAPSFTAVAPYCQNATATALTATGSNLLWYASATGGVGSAIAPTPSTATDGTINYYVTQTVNGCESLRAEIPVTTIALPAAPAVTSLIGYCEGFAAPALTATGSNLLWYSAATGGVGNTTAPTPSTATSATTNYYVSQTVNNCEGPRAMISVEVSPVPSAPVFAITQPNCAVNTATISISSPVGVNLEYSIDNGTNYQSGTMFSGVAAGATYDVIVRNALSACVSPTVPAVVNPALIIPAAPTAAVSAQPNCYTPTGTIEISAPLGANLEYTINGGGAYQSGTTFAGLAPNASYTLSVRDTATGCVSTTTIVNVDAMPANPAAPTLTIVQPICTTPTGTVTISAPTGANLEYSINGGTAYQASPVFVGLAPSTNYNLIVRDLVTGCVSTASVAAVNAIPANPAVPTVTITQPICGDPTGSFVVSAPVGGNFEYSIDGGLNYQSGTTFAGLAAGVTYSATVRDVTTGCVSAARAVVINPALNVPPAPTVGVTVQPICSAPTGTIVVSAPLGANLSYSINGGTNFQAGTTFAGLAPNTTYSVIVRDNVSGCVSTASTAFVDPLPANPPAPTASATVQPICTTPTGTIVITAPVGTDFEYSINGGSGYQAGTTFASLAPNATYNLIVRNTVTGCVSAPTAVVIDPIPANPAAPTGTMTQPTCTAPTGAISVANPTGANLEYSIDGGINYQAGTDFSGLAPNATYSIVVRNTQTGCVSAPGTFTIIPAPTFPATPVATGSDVCAEETITLSTPLVAGATYSWTGPNGFTSSLQNPTIANADASMAGTYSVVISTSANCPSLPGSVTIAVNPLPLPTLPQDGNICYNTVTNTVVTPYVLTTGLSDAQYDFEWYLETDGSYSQIVNEYDSSYSASAPGNYGVIAVDLVTGCASHMVTTTVNMTSPPLAIEVVASDYFDQSQTIAVSVVPSGDYEYQLDNGAFQPGSVFTNVLPGEHIVKVRNACGTLEDVAFLMDYPKFFTPNGDGYNDTWNIFALKGQANAKIYIFDRYGKLLKEISPSGKGWDGTFNQNILPATDYWFSVHYEEDNVSKVFKSHFALKR
ncbi:choice-of-anchor L domain-containing protein [Flavobacterium caeni]|uniref:Gliding motility-associated C-terminal domain-containing protein n=1 Tax=Flavobacterium caeni TaxID=490189 RepID=A0A1G5IBA6_9FLAO|nr:choice-of-anchor L domain-containing protein [Flavobacterium caeni]SCY72889.1 gliding motility-associated C-terminal domain-containing protein [Flavobacterium caeni]